MTDLEKRFLKNTDDTGRFIYQSLVTGRKYYVEPIGGHSDWGDINPATKEVEGDYGEKYKGSVSEKESMITPENVNRNDSWACSSVYMSCFNGRMFLFSPVLHYHRQVLRN